MNMMLTSLVRLLFFPLSLSFINYDYYKSLDYFFIFSKFEHEHIPYNETYQRYKHACSPLAHLPAQLYVVRPPANQPYKPREPSKYKNVQNRS